MKNYAVVRVFEYSYPNVVFQSDSYDDCIDYARIMHRNDGYKYAVVHTTDQYSD